MLYSSCNTAPSVTLHHRLTLAWDLYEIIYTQRYNKFIHYLQNHNNLIYIFIDY